MAPPRDSGRVSSNPPGIHAGNMDNKELVAGTILAWPRAETRAHFIAMGMDRDLTRATQIAVQNAIDFLAAYRGWSKMEAYRFVSVARATYVSPSWWTATSACTS
ncbi:MAG TPA: hypothetical protein VGQ25_11500 [Gemmatimonadales bacterium]|nr:hypothetical protein [Gemmatimonadales bacterium]